jgi:phosphoglycerate dehydrogenase-like enzyme
MAGGDLVVALDLEWDDDFALERAALAGVGVSLARAAELRENDATDVVALLTASTRVDANDLLRYPRLRVVSEFGTGPRRPGRRAAAAAAPAASPPSDAGHASLRQVLGCGGD